MSKETVHIQAKITKALRDEFKSVAQANAQNPSALIRMWIENYIEENSKEETKMKDQGFGTVEFEGKEYTLKQQAYIDGKADERPYYRAMAVDQEGNEHEVTWDVVDNWEEIEDESESCDWDEPESVEKI